MGAIDAWAPFKWCTCSRRGDDEDITLTYLSPLSFPFLFCPNSKRTESIPKYTQKKQWMNVQTELTSYSYNLREAMLRLADYSSNKDAAKSAAQAYFVDINDIFVATKGKDGAKVDAIYSKSLDDLKAFKASLQ